MTEHDGCGGTWGLMLAFDSDTPEFARGCEVGMLFERLQHLTDDAGHTALVHGANVEMVCRISEATSRRISIRDIDLTWMEATFGPAESR